MRALRQLHYTSAAADGAGTGSGFRFTAVSPGADTGALRQVEPLLGYEPPNSSPARPTDAELAAFPVSFGFSRLPDGTGLLSRTVYTGADYSGRYGNFHAHAVLLPGDGELPGGLLPIEAWQSPDWCSVTPDRSEPEPLERLRRGGQFGHDVLTSFARSRATRLAAVLSDVRRLFAAEPGPPLVVVEDGAEQIARWVALACGALPRAHAAALTFTTYTRRPYLAEQQIIGVLPDADFGFSQAELAHQYRVHHCLGGPSSPPGEDDAWAAVAARIWLAGRPDLFHAAPGRFLTDGADGADGPGGVGGRGSGGSGRSDMLYGSDTHHDSAVPDGPATPDPFAAPPLAALALSAGIPLDRAGRAAAARWAVPRAGQGGPGFWRTFLEGLLTEPSGERPSPGRAGDDDQVLFELLAALGTRWPLEVTGPLVTALVRRAVHDGGPLPRPERVELTDEARWALARETGPALVGQLTDHGTSLGRVLALLGLADRLGVAYAAAVPVLSARLSQYLLSPRPVRPDPGRDEPEPRAEEVVSALAGGRRAALRAALLDRLADVAIQDDPWPVAVALGRLFPPWDPAELTEYPHLRMADAARLSGRRRTGDLSLLHRLTRESGPTTVTDPTVLRTAYRLTYPDHRPSTDDLWQLLNELPPDLLAASGLAGEMIGVALGAPAGDEHAPELAGDLLKWLPEDGDAAGRRERAALRLLHWSEQIRTGRAAPGFTARTVALLSSARPLEEQVERRLGRDLATCILSGILPDERRPDVSNLVLLDEQHQLARSGEPGLLRAYLREAGQPLRVARLRDDPRYLASCFIAWNSHQGAGHDWDEGRHRLLEEVLRPVVRKLPDASLDTVEEYLAVAGPQWTDRWRQWRRPGVLRRWSRLRGPGPRSGSGSDSGSGSGSVSGSGSAERPRGPWTDLARGSSEPPDGTDSRR